MKNRIFRIAACTLFIIAVVCILSRINIITVNNNRIILFNDPFERGSGSARADIIDAFCEKGESAENIIEILYKGTSFDGVYYTCKYLQPDGSVIEFYAFDDNDLSSFDRATVFWMNKIR